MKTRSLFSAIGMTLVAIVLVGAYGYLVTAVWGEREAYANLLAESQLKETRERAVTRLRNSVRDTRDERETLEARTDVEVLQAVSTIEAVAAASKVGVVIDGATSASKEHVRSIIVSVTLSGGIAPLMEALTVLETMPFPAVIEHIDMIATKEKKDVWTARLRLRFITTSQVGV